MLRSQGYPDISVLRSYTICLMLGTMLEGKNRHVLVRAESYTNRLYRTVRSKKVAFVQGSYRDYGSRVEIVALDDLVNGDYSAALKGWTGPVDLQVMSC